MSLDRIECRERTLYACKSATVCDDGVVDTEQTGRCGEQSTPITGGWRTRVVAAGVERATRSEAVVQQRSKDNRLPF